MANKDQSALKRHQAFILRGMRLISLLILAITVLITTVACIDIVGHFQWGASWTSLPVGLVFMAISLLICGGTTWALRQMRSSQ
jgi:uncharacterized RDD family membrane protein YckC